MDNFIEKWSKTRTKGKFKFVLIDGVLGYGLITAIVCSVILQIISPQKNIFLRPLIFLIVFSIIGIIKGLLSWYRNEKKYQNLTENSSDL